MVISSPYDWCLTVEKSTPSSSDSLKQISAGSSRTTSVGSSSTRTEEDATIADSMSSLSQTGKSSVPQEANAEDVKRALSALACALSSAGDKNEQAEEVNTERDAEALQQQLLAELQIQVAKIVDAESAQQQLLAELHIHVAKIESTAKSAIEAVVSGMPEAIRAKIAAQSRNRAEQCRASIALRIAKSKVEHIDPDKAMHSAGAHGGNGRTHACVCRPSSVPRLDLKSLQGFRGPAAVPRLDSKSVRGCEFWL